MRAKSSPNTSDNFKGMIFIILSYAVSHLSSLVVSYIILTEHPVIDTTVSKHMRNIKYAKHYLMQYLSWFRSVLF